MLKKKHIMVEKIVLMGDNNKKKMLKNNFSGFLKTLIYF